MKQNNNMFILFIRSIIIYVIVLIIFRLMGKRQMGELQPFEFVITLIIADLATIPMAEINIPLLHGIIPLVTLTILQFFISLLSCKSIHFRKVVNGKAVIIVSPNGIDYENMKSLNMNINDLTESLRVLNYYSLDQIAYAIVETNGKISVIPNADNAPLTASDLKIKKEKSLLPLILISEGKIIKENLEVSQIEESFVLKQLKNNGIYDVKEVVIATIDNNGKMYLQAINSKYKCFQTNYKGGTW